MKGVLAYALARMRVKRGRAVVAAAGIAAASAMLGAAITVGYGLGTGFDRTARAAGMPDAVARFNDLSATNVGARVSALPNLRAAAYRLEATGETVSARGHVSYNATLEGVRPGPRGYAVVAGRDLERPGEALVERGLARAWGLRPGDTLAVDDFAAGRMTLRIVGVAVSPDNVAYPLASSPHVYAGYSDVARASGAPPDAVNVALLWAADPHRLDVTLAQARAASFGVRDLRFLSRSGIHALVGRAAGIVIALLVAFSVVALAAAGTMLAASAGGEAQRRLPAIGVLRVFGASPRTIVAGAALEGAAIALPAAAVGIACGWLVVRGPTSHLLEAVNQLPPGVSLLPPLAACLAAVIGLVAAATAWPTWRAARRPPAGLLRGADVVGTARRSPLPGGPFALGMRLAAARPWRTAGLVAVLAASAAVVLLVLAIASLLGRLQNDPATVGKRYGIEAYGPVSALPAVRRVPGVAAATPRYEIDAADSFELGEYFHIVAFPGDHTVFEAPELVSGRRVSGPDEAEVGLGLAQSLSLSPGATLAAQLPSGAEVRFRVVGIVRALEDQGRIAYVQPSRLLRAGIVAQPTLAVRLAPGASSDAVRAALARLGVDGEPASGVAGEAVRGWAARNSGFIDVLVALLRSVAVLDAIVCLYAVAQMLTLTAQERRRAVAVMRACGASPRQVHALFAGASLLVAALALPPAILLERLVFAPVMGRLAASYAALDLGAGAVPISLVAAGLAVVALGAAALVARGATTAPIASGLRGD